MYKIDGTSGAFTSRQAARNRGFYVRHVKRLLDLAIVVILAPVVATLVLVAFVLARMDGGPGLFGHVRIGRNGKPFTCWKIRTMHRDAGARLVSLLATDVAAAQAWDSHGKLQRDPRVTRLGRVLRRFSIDELPQLWNVARGEMSLVGPRPVTASELERYGARQRYYIACRPGITGLWQVSGRNALCYDDRMALDQRYAERVGLVTDLVLMARTVPAIFGMSGH
jgi:lipopolysaccharide/colanic/teichoic acid biosynthesis glycosyltransferase